MICRLCLLFSCMNNHPLEMQHKHILCGNWTRTIIEENYLFYYVVIRLEARVTYCTKIHIFSQVFNLIQTMWPVVLDNTNSIDADTWYANVTILSRASIHLPAYLHKIADSNGAFLPQDLDTYLPSPEFIAWKSQSKQTKHLPEIMWTGFGRSKNSSGMRTDDHAYRAWMKFCQNGIQICCVGWVDPVHTTIEFNIICICAIQKA